MPSSISTSGTMLFHHHEKVYQDEQGKLWMSSSLGIWLDEIAKNVERLLIFNFEEFKKTNKHDYCLSQMNIELISLGSNLGYVDYFSKRIRIKNLCKEWCHRVDYLLIRGFTPFQNKVWNGIDPRLSKSYILVRSLKQPRPLKLARPLSWLAYLFNKLQELRFKEIINSADNLFTNSFEVQKELSRYDNVRAIFSSTNVLKSCDFQNFEFKTWSAEFHLLFVGRISTLKGCTELAEAFCETQQQKREIKIKLHMVGEGDPSYISELKEMFFSKGLLGQVEFHGRVPFGKELFSLYQRANAFVLPSYTEGFPRVIWEAALFSVPIVVTSVGGIPAIIKNEEHALVLPSRDKEALCAALSTVIGQKSESFRRARNAHKLALDYTLESGVGILTSKIKDIE